MSPLGVLPRIPLPGCMLVVALTGVNQLWCLQRADMKTHAEYVVSYQRPDSIMVSSCGRDQWTKPGSPARPAAVVCYSLELLQDPGTCRIVHVHPPLVLGVKPRHTFWVCLRTQRFGTWAAVRKSSADLPGPGFCGAVQGCCCEGPSPGAYWDHT